MVFVLWVMRLMCIRGCLVSTTASSDKDPPVRVPGQIFQSLGFIGRPLVGCLTQPPAFQVVGSKHWIIPIKRNVSFL